MEGEIHKEIQEGLKANAEKLYGRNGTRGGSQVREERDSKSSVIVAGGLALDMGKLTALQDRAYV